MTENHSSEVLTQPQRPENWWRLPLWICSGILAAGVLSVTAAYAPAGMKRILIFYIIYGGACGFVLNWLAGEILTGQTRFLSLSVALICFAGAVNLGFLSFRHFEQGRQQLARERPKDIEILESLRVATGQDPDAQKEYEKELRRYYPRFDDYLRHRVSNLGNWPSPWPEVLWGIELLLSAIAGGVTFSKLRGRSINI
ncbi:MAG TPA: hypothetical protein VNQ76_13100 [Planctomicrobium sp.]|nr:hypothetical protein [Planctomicrobium sp.]